MSQIPSDWMMVYDTFKSGTFFFEIWKRGPDGKEVAVAMSESDANIFATLFEAAPALLVAVQAGKVYAEALSKYFDGGSDEGLDKLYDAWHQATTTALEKAGVK